MATLFYISDGNSGVQLNDGVAASLIFPYVPRVAAAGKDTVTETVKIIMTGPLATAEANLNAIRQLLQQAAERKERDVGARLYAYIQKDTDTGIWRSRILGGVVEDASDSLEPNRRGTGRLEAAIIWERAGYWEGPEATLVNAETVENDNTGSAFNYVVINSGQVTGDLPSPAIIQIANNHNSATAATIVYIAHNVYSTPQTFTHFIQGEDAIGGSPIGDASASGGQYQQRTWAGTTELGAMSWVLSGTLLAEAGGNVFRVLMRTASPGGNEQVRLRLESGGVVVWEGSWKKIAGQLHELANVRLPHMRTSGSTLANMGLLMDLRKTGGGTVNVDYLQLSPLDSWRKLTPPRSGYNLAYGNTLVDDPIGEEIYLLVGGTTKAPGYTALGQPIMLIPARSQRLYFLMDDDNSAAAIARTSQITVKYRPRRATL